MICIKLLLIRSLILRAGLRTLRAALRAVRILTSRTLLSLVHLLESLIEGLGIPVDVSEILALDSLLKGGDICLDLGLDISGNLIAIVLEELLSLEAKGISVVDLVNPLLGGLVSGLVGLGLIPHPLDLSVRKT